MNKKFAVLRDNVRNLTPAVEDLEAPGAGGERERGGFRVEGQRHLQPGAQAVAGHGQKLDSAQRCQFNADNENKLLKLIEEKVMQLRGEVNKEQLTRVDAIDNIQKCLTVTI